MSLKPWTQSILPTLCPTTPVQTRTFYFVVVSCQVVSYSLQRHGLQPARPLCPSPSLSLPKFTSIESVMPSNYLILCRPLLLLLLIFSSIGVFPVSLLFSSGGQSIGASTSASVLPGNIQAWVPLELTGWSPCSAGDSQESSLIPQFKSINSSVLSLL